MGGILVFGVLYGGGFLAMWWLRWPVPAIVATLIGALALGIFAWSYRVWLSRERHRLRLGWLLATRPDEIAALRRTRALLVRLIVRGERRWVAAGGSLDLTRAS